MEEKGSGHPGLSGVPPLIVTLEFNEASFRRLEELRRLHFPPERNLVPAHLTLFHKLPGECEAEIADALRQAAMARTGFSFQLSDMGLRFLGQGVALELPSPELSELRAGLARRWTEWLTPQDRQGFRPHVTIQNKAGREPAQALFDELRTGFTFFHVEATGLLLWRYLDGPWDAAGRFPFSDAK